MHINIFGIFKHAREKPKEWKCKNFEKIKYEISTNLPLARARHFKSNVQDFFFAVFTIGHLVLEK